MVNPPLQTLFGRLRERGLVRPEIAEADLVQVFKMTQLGLTGAWVLEGPPWKETKRLARQQIRIFCEGIGRAERT